MADQEQLNRELLDSAYNGDLSGVKSALDKGADVNCIDANYGYTPLHRASYMGRSEVVSMLLSAGAEKDATDSDGNTPLHDASYMGRSEVVNMLLTAGADKDATNSSGNTALHRACDANEPEVVEILISAGVNIDLRNNVEGWTALHFATYFDHTGIVQILLTAGCSIHAITNNGETPLDLAEVCGHHEIIEILQTFVTSGSLLYIQ